MSTNKKTEQNATQPALKPGQYLSINGNIVESIGGDVKPAEHAEKLPTPKSGNMNASRVAVSK